MRSWYENLCRYPESHRGIGNRRPMIPARCGHYPGPRNFAGQQVGERTARLERPRVLKKLKFEAEVRGSQTEIRRIDLADRSLPNVGSDQPLRPGDIVSINVVVGLDVHGSIPRRLDYASVPSPAADNILHGEPYRRPTMGKLDGKVAIVTGAARGLGRGS